MQINKDKLQQINQQGRARHDEQFNFLADSLSRDGVNVDAVVKRLSAFQVAVPSWALGAGGTRFGRFSFHGEPGALEQKIDDVGILHALTQTAGAVSLHIPWDTPTDYGAVKHRTIYDELKAQFSPRFAFQGLPAKGRSTTSLPADWTYARAYHQLMIELVGLQADNIRAALGGIL